MRKKQMVVKANELIEARYKLDLEEQKLLLYLIAQIEPQDHEFKKYTVSVAEFSKVMGYRQDNVYSNFMEICQGLMSKPLRIVRGEETSVLNWLAEAIYHEGKGTVTLIFPSTLMPFLLEIKKNFTPYALDNIKKLKSIYGIRMYELLKQYQKIGTRTFDVESLKDILCVSDLYADYFDFKKYVILTAQKELLAKCDICFEFEEIKSGRKVDLLKFYIYQNQKKNVIHAGASEQELLSDTGGRRPDAADPQPDLTYIEERDLIGYAMHILFDLAHGDMALIKRAYQYVKKQNNVRSFKGLWYDMIEHPERISEDIQIQPAAPKSRFCNYNSRKNDYAELERLEQENFRKSCLEFARED